MHRSCVHALALAVLCLMAAGCGPIKPASPSIFFGNCITPPGPDPCDSDMDICRVYQDVIEQQYASAAPCRAACNQAYTNLYAQNYQLRNCGYMLTRGTDLCEQECLRQYPAGK
ncbi:hypothetical protein DFW101_3377 [Solidesulfovibrio carbinoliphilus subsp. oakridgensis]|uniref:Lipoprotein n=1 Tax=Solidesulfovibrio carbinoliphilus subsp. oakridgensis TaxID=694327 RepID=G7QBF2_9BACT|nr:hypothetical protein [Solidesulfovibrio carbinoliphilus]EHJ49375.1 hypothetical protein DFW101_3377 [Solidesulfovibrio carbinoliphilus subsp. oakridgensis]